MFYIDLRDQVRVKCSFDKQYQKYMFSIYLDKSNKYFHFSKICLHIYIYLPRQISNGWLHHILDIHLHFDMQDSLKLIPNTIGMFYSYPTNNL
jgi:hypothetical protein